MWPERQPGKSGNAPTIARRLLILARRLVGDRLQ